MKRDKRVGSIGLVLFKVSVKAFRCVDVSREIGKCIQLQSHSTLKYILSLLSSKSVKIVKVTLYDSFRKKKNRHQQQLPIKLNRGHNFIYAYSVDYKTHSIHEQNERMKTYTQHDDEKKAHTDILCRGIF